MDSHFRSCGDGLLIYIAQMNRERFRGVGNVWELWIKSIENAKILSKITFSRTLQTKISRFLVEQRFYKTFGKRRGQNQTRHLELNVNGFVNKRNAMFTKDSLQRLSNFTDQLPGRSVVRSVYLNTSIIIVSGWMEKSEFLCTETWNCWPDCETSLFCGNANNDWFACCPICVSRLKRSAKHI